MLREMTQKKREMVNWQNNEMEELKKKLEKSQEKLQGMKSEIHFSQNAMKTNTSDLYSNN